MEGGLITPIALISTGATRGVTSKAMQFHGLNRIGIQQIKPFLFGLIHAECFPAGRRKWGCPDSMDRSLSRLLNR